MSRNKYPRAGGRRRRNSGVSSPGLSRSLHRPRGDLLFLLMAASDFLVIGGGIVGISIAREIKSRFSDAGVLLIEKELACGLHASGRNSGVLHSGFYYSADSLKARFTRVGNEAMTAYCEARGIPLNKCGKLVVAKDESELAQ